MSKLTDIASIKHIFSLENPIINTKLLRFCFFFIFYRCSFPHHSQSLFFAFDICLPLFCFLLAEYVLLQVYMCLCACITFSVFIYLLICLAQFRRFIKRLFFINSNFIALNIFHGIVIFSFPFFIYIFLNIFLSLSLSFFLCLLSLFYVSLFPFTFLFSRYFFFNCLNYFISFFISFVSSLT